MPPPDPHRTDADGLLSVLENQDQQIRVYDPTGRRVRTIGRRSGH